MNNEFQKLYEHRFPQHELKRKNEIWRVVVQQYLQNFVRGNDTVIDAACGYGEFINNVMAARKIAIDLNEDAAHFLQPDVEFLHGDSIAMLSQFTGVADVIFTSNFLEHLPDKKTLNIFLDTVMNSLKPGGQYLILGPNLRYLPGKYWDFYDHELGLSHLSLTEALEWKGFRITRCVDKFLPYTTKGKLPTHPFLVSLYLRVQTLWRVMGAQFFIVAQKH